MHAAAPDDDDRAWLALARALALTPWDYRLYDGFARLERVLLRPASGPTTVHDGLTGAWRGLPCLVLYAKKTSVGRHHSLWPTVTDVYVELPRPLLLGARIASEPLVSLLGLAQATLGLPAVDARLELQALDPARLVALLRQDASDLPFLEGLCRLAETDSLTVFDGLVRIRQPRLVTDPARVAWARDQAAAIAHELSRRREKVSATRAELAARAEWRRFAEARGAAYDAPSMRLQLPLAGGAMHVALEPFDAGIGTAVTVRFDRPFAPPLYARSSVAHYVAPAERALATGDRAFDAQFSLLSRDALNVPAVLSPARRVLLLRIGAAAQHVWLTEGSITWTFATPAVTAADLETNAHMAAQVLATFST